MIDDPRESVPEPREADDQRAHAEDRADEKVAVPYARCAHHDIGQHERRRHFTQHEYGERAVAFERLMQPPDARSPELLNTVAADPSAETETGGGAGDASSHRVHRTEPWTKRHACRSDQS